VPPGAMVPLATGQRVRLGGKAWRVAVIAGALACAEEDYFKPS
jgi:hypothetical protein